LLGGSVEVGGADVLGVSDACSEGNVLGDLLGLVDGDALGEALGTATLITSTTTGRTSTGRTSTTSVWLRSVETDVGCITLTN